ncbi:lysophospholipid acyltransferase family protein [Oxalobacteraceae bacterium]|nr:lysophospholipid acyltransferase family protein [Oxalobacteraceae bacterium]
MNQANHFSWQRRLLFRLPRPLCHAVAYAVGTASYLVDRHGCRSEITPLVRAALHTGRVRAGLIACGAAITSTRYGFDSGMLLAASVRQHRRWNARNRFAHAEHLEQAAAKGRGVILAASNFSCFYYAMMTPFERDSSDAALRMTLVRPKLAAIDPLFTELCDKVLAVSGRSFDFIETGGKRAALDFIGALRQRRTVVCMVDFISDDTLAVPASFFGRPACLPGGYLLMAERTGAPVVPCTTRFVGGRFVTTFGAPIDPADCPDEDRISWMAQRLNAALEAEITPAPAGWGAWGSLKLKWELGEQIGAA